MLDQAFADPASGDSRPLRWSKFDEGLRELQVRQRTGASFRLGQLYALPAALHRAATRQAFRIAKRTGRRIDDGVLKEAVLCVIRHEILAWDATADAVAGLVGLERLDGKAQLYHRLSGLVRAASRAVEAELRKRQTSPLEPGM